MMGEQVVADQLQQLRAKYKNFKYIPLRVFIQMIDLECKLRPRKTRPR